MVSEIKSPASELKRWRTGEGLSQQAAADQIEVSRLSVVEIETGKRQITAPMAIKLETATGIDAKRWMWWQINIEIDRLRGEMK